MGVTSTTLVWVPEEGLPYLADLEANLEIRATPAQPLSDPRIAEVEVWVPPTRSELRSLMPHMTNLKLVQCASAGVDSVVGQVPAEITLCSAKGALDTHVSEWVMAAILAAFKELHRFMAEQRRESWQRHPVTLLADAHVLLLGYGSIAKAVEHRLTSFGPAITRVARRPRPGVLPIGALSDVLPGADVVVILLPLTPATERLVGRDFLAQLPDGALVVNAARGKIIDTEALLAELGSGRLRAALDVTDPEPLPPGHPLYQAPGVSITPHVSWWTTEGVKANYEVVARQLSRYARSEPLMNVVHDGY